MAQIGLTEAARLAGRNQSDHSPGDADRAVVLLDHSAGKRVVDTAELDRVFGVRVSKVDSLASVNGTSLDGHAHAAKSNAAHEQATVLLPGEHAALHQLLADREASIADLRGRLDASEAERRAVQERLTAVLTHRQPGSVPAVAADFDRNPPAVVAALVSVSQNTPNRRHYDNT